MWYRLVYKLIWSYTRTTFGQHEHSPADGKTIVHQSTSIDQFSCLLQALYTLLCVFSQFTHGCMIEWMPLHINCNKTRKKVILKKKKQVSIMGRLVRRELCWWIQTHEHQYASTSVWTTKPHTVRPEKLECWSQSMLCLYWNWAITDLTKNSYIYAV